jgi:hypothetical protein
MLGSTCSQCCGWRCYYSDDSSPPITPANFTLGTQECSDERFVTVKLQWDTPFDGDCIPEMLYDVDISANYVASTNSGTWQPARLASGDLAYYIPRSDVLTNNVELKCEYDVYFPEETQINFFRANGYVLNRKVHFRVRSTAISGSYTGQSSDWTVVGPFTDPRYCGNNFAEVTVDANEDFFEVPLMINHSVYTPEGCATPFASVDVYAIVSKIDNTLPNPAVKNGMYFNTTSSVTLGIPLNADGSAVEGTGLLPYDGDVVALWVLVQMQDAREVLEINKMGLDV